MCRTNVLEFFVAALFAIENGFNNLTPTSRGLVELIKAHVFQFMYNRSVPITKNDTNLHAVIWKESQDVMLIFRTQGAEWYACMLPVVLKGKKKRSEVKKERRNEGRTCGRKGRRISKTTG